MIWAAMLQLSAIEGLPNDSWAQVSAERLLAGSLVTVDFVRDREARENSHYTLRLTRSRAGFSETLWATSRTCGAVRDAVDSLKAVPLPEPKLPNEGTSSVRDGTLYVVRYDARYGDDQAGPVELSSNVETPLARWVDDLFAKLTPCWSHARSR